MLGGQRRAETLAHRSAVLLPHPMQHPAPKFLPIAAVGSAPRAAVLQTCRTFLAIALPQPLGLAITDVQQPARIDDPQLPTAHSRQHFHPSQFLLTHLCPPQSDLLSEVVLRGHFYRGQKGTLSARHNTLGPGCGTRARLRPEDFFPSHSELFHSCLSATPGSTRIARRAGM